MFIQLHAILQLDNKILGTLLHNYTLIIDILTVLYAIQNI